MGYGKRRYGRLNKPVAPPPPEATPTYVCNHCGKIKQFSPRTVTLTGVIDNALFLTGRICEDCGKLLQDWMKT